MFSLQEVYLLIRKSIFLTVQSDSDKIIDIERTELDFLSV